MKHEGPTMVISGGGTGGHLYPALAIADAVTALRPDVRWVYVGAEGGLEARVVPERGVPYLLLPVRGLARRGLLRNVTILRDLVRSVTRVGALFHRVRPAVTVVTGGYAGAPAGVVSAASGVPLVLQEQNSRPGVATRVLARWARQVHVAFPEAERWLPRAAPTEVSGNPIRDLSGVTTEEAKRAFGIPVEAAVVLVVGGSQGSRAINRAVLDAVRRVEAREATRPERLHLLWATGPAHYEEVRGDLEVVGAPAWVHAVHYIDDVPAALASADLAVARGGAMTTSEFHAVGLPSVLVPLPTSAEGHQTDNAVALERAGASVHLPQDRLDELWTVVTGLFDDPARLEAQRKAALARGRPRAARRIAEAVSSLLPPPVRGAA